MAHSIDYTIAKHAQTIASKTKKKKKDWSGKIWFKVWQH